MTSMRHSTSRILRDYTPDIPTAGRDEEIVRAAWRHAEAGRNVLPREAFGHKLKAKRVTKLSEVPCRVSSDLHERRNERSTVSTTDPVKL